MDALREIGTIGAGNAATALSQLVDKKILISVPRLDIVPIQKVPEVIGGPETLVAAVYIQLLGDVTGSMLYTLPKEGASLMVSLLRGKARAPKVLTETDREMLKQTGAILIASYLNALTRFTGLVMLPSPAAFAFDMAGAIVDSIVIKLSLRAEKAVLIETDFIETSGRARGQLFFIPDPKSLEVILGKIGVK
jgi:chemotaxis protein CheC